MELRFNWLFPGKNTTNIVLCAVVLNKDFTIGMLIHLWQLRTRRTHSESDSVCVCVCVSNGMN